MSTTPATTDSGGSGATAELRVSSLAWWIGYAVLIAVAIIAVAVITADPLAGFVAGGFVVLSATWTAGRYRRG